MESNRSNKFETLASIIGSINFLLLGIDRADLQEAEDLFAERLARYRAAGILTGTYSLEIAASLAAEHRQLEALRQYIDACQAVDAARAAEQEAQRQQEINIKFGL